MVESLGLWVINKEERAQSGQDNRKSKYQTNTIFDNFILEGMKY